jgi:tetratricopeptide (TPR) repeat protein
VSRTGDFVTGLLDGWRPGFTRRRGTIPVSSWSRGARRTAGGRGDPVIGLILALLGVLLGGSQLMAGTNQLVFQRPASAAAPDASDPVEKEYQKLLADDDAAQEEADRLIRNNEQFAEKGAGFSPAELRGRIRAHLDAVRGEYESFLKRNPRHARARIAYASFLGDLGEDDTAQEQLEKALPLDPKNPAIYNNLANIYGHIGPVKKAFEYYAKAIELNPLEPIYYQNFGTTVFLFRPDAREYFGITEQQVFDKALELYGKATKLAPEDFLLATDVAQTYYGIQPRRTEDALRSWTNALSLAHDEIEREGVYIHLARIKTQWAGRYEEARAQLEVITNDMYADLKKRLLRNLDEAEKKAHPTNSAPK